MNDTKKSNLIVHFNCMKEIPLKVNGKKKLIIQFNFILEIPLKMNVIKKNNALQFYERNPFKTEQTQKIKNGEFLANKASQPL